MMTPQEVASHSFAKATLGGDFEKQAEGAL